MATRPKRFRLSFVGPIEDQPRLIRAYGRACDGEFALVMRPSEERAVLVLVTKKEGAWMWRTGGAPPDDGLVRARATVLRDGRTKLRVESGEQAGVSFLPYQDLPAGIVHGSVVEIAFNPDDQFAHVRGPGAGGDAPQRPSTPIEQVDAVKLVKIEQKAVPREGPTTLRGRWTGVLTCDDGQPRVELRRRLASYGTLIVRSDPDDGWSWRFEREDKWFTDAEATSGDGLRTLSQAIEAGVLGAMSLVRQACGFRDTRRRAAQDEGYAEKHPIRPPKPTKDPTERLGARSRARKPATASATSEDKPTATRRRRTKKPAEEVVFERMPKKATESAYAWAQRLLGEADARVGEGHHRAARELLEQVGKVATGLSGSKASRIYERVKHIEGKLEATRADAAAPVGSKRRAKAESAEADEASDGAHAAKDKALIDAFSAAIASALGPGS